MRIVSNIEREPVPAGKRTVRETVWGNTEAYVGGRRWLTIGSTSDPVTKQRVANWLAGREPDDDVEEAR
jgi:hypothetical protein